MGSVYINYDNIKNLFYLLSGQKDLAHIRDPNFLMYYLVVAYKTMCMMVWGMYKTVVANIYIVLCKSTQMTVAYNTE